MDKKVNNQKAAAEKVKNEVSAAEFASGAEIIIVSEKNDTVNLTDGKVDSFRQVDETRKTVRVYASGNIAVAGGLGDDVDLKELEKTAKETLEQGGESIPYVCELNKNVKSVIKDKPAISAEKFLPAAKRLAAKVAKACPEFLVNGKIQTETVEKTYANTKGSDLKFKNSDFSFTFILKDRNSSNIMDAAYGSNARYYGKSVEDKIVRDMVVLRDAFFGKKVTLKDGEYPFIFSTYDVLGHLIKDFVAEMYVSNGSLLSGKLGQKVFNENLSVYVDKNLATNHTASFFDAEGEIAPDYRPKLIENGVLKGLLANKNTAKMFGLPLIKSAAAAYDGVPQVGLEGLYLKSTAPDLKAILGKKRAILIDTTSGGDVTPDGKMGLPVQLAFLVENGKIVSRVTDFHLSANVFDLLGKDLLGVTDKGVYEMPSLPFIVAKANLING
ncbi:MAG: metallopeptidase TldD-related protein [Candidatus Borkfalkiaceae bacterium]|nr:metallopeptidase TldD-related protein [Christensenellaceae bacterium]